MNIICYMNLRRLGQRIGRFWKGGVILLWIAVSFPACKPSTTDPSPQQGNGLETGGNDNVANGDSSPVESRVDERGLLAGLSHGGRTLTFDWSPEASRVQVTFDNEGVITHWSLEVSFQDEAILEALDFLENELDEDLSGLRQWVFDHPGRAAIAADGSNPLARAGASPLGKAAVLQQQVLPPVGEHLDGLREELARFARIVYLLGISFYQSGSEPQDVQDEYEQAFRLAQDGWRQAREDLSLQERECAICSLVCRADCTEPNLGSCCRYAAGRSQCLPSDSKACTDDGGFFFQGLSCADVACPEAGACCTNIDCLDANETMCDLIGGKFTARAGCLETDCGPGACYTLYETSLGDACCDCRRTNDNECREFPRFHFFARHEECPGACYVGEGEDVYCYEDKESECLANGGTSFFHEAICQGICLYETGCMLANTRQCDELGGYMYYNLDYCSGACEYYDLNRQESRCTRTSGPAECGGLGGTFWIGQSCF